MAEENFALLQFFFSPYLEHWANTLAGNGNMDRATLHQFWHFVDTDSYEKVRTLITRFCPDVTSRFPFRSSDGQQSGTGASPYFRSVMRPVRNRQLHFARAVVEQRRGTGSITVHRSSGGAAVELWQINNSCPTEMGVPKTTGFATPVAVFGFREPSSAGSAAELHDAIRILRPVRPHRGIAIRYRRGARRVLRVPGSFPQSPFAVRLHPI